MATPIYNPATDIKALAEARKKAEQVGLQTAQQKSLAELAKTKTAIAPEYQKQRNIVSTTAQQQARNFAEYMAQRGQNVPTGQSGTMAQAELTRGAVTQGQLGALATGQAGAMAENLRQAGQVNVGYQQGLAQSQANIEAQKMQQLIAAQQQYNAQKRAEEQQVRALASQQAIALAKAKSKSATPTGQGNAPKTTTANTNTILSDIEGVVRDRNENYDDRMKILEAMKSSVAGRTGEQANYIKTSINNAIKAIQAQKQEFINVGRYAGM